MTKNKATILYLGFNYTFMTNIIFPALPGIQSLFALSSTELSLMASAPALINLLFQPFAGWLSDRLNRANFVFVGLMAYALGAAISAVVLLFSGIYALVLMGRMIMGIGELGAFPQYLALIRERLARDERHTAMGQMESFTSIGGTVAPAIGGFLAGVALGLPFWGSAIAAIFAMVIFRLFGMGTPDRQTERPATATTKKQESLTTWKFHYGFLGGYLVLGTLVVFQTFIGSIMDQEFGFSTAQIGFSLAIVPLAMAIGSFVMAWAGDRLTNTVLLTLIGLLGIIGIFMIAWSSRAGFVLLGLGLVGFVLGFWLPVLDHDVAEAGSSSTSGARLSIFQQSKSFGILTMPIFVGFAIDIFGSFRPALTLLGVSCLLMGFVTLFLRSRSQFLPVTG